MRNCLKTIISISAVVSVLGLNSSVFGVASFARQTGLDCTSCHTSAGFPTLNTFGAAFKAGGYVNGDDANMMGDGEALSIPKTLNLSLVAKVRAKYMVSGDGKGGSSSGEMEVDMPDEYALMMGGRVSKNIGFLTEFALTGPNIGAVRLPVVFDVGPGKLGVVVWGTDGFGPSMVFETAATGAQRNLRVFENVKGAGHEFGSDQASSGLGAYYYHSMFFVAYTPYTNTLGSGMVHRSMGHYARVAVTPNVAGLDLLVGGQMTYGNAGEIEGAGRVKSIQSRSSIDAQVAGTLGVPMLIFFQYGTLGENDDANAGGVKTAIRVGVDAQIIENKLNVGAAFTQDAQDVAASAPAGTKALDAQNYIVGALKYNLARNVRANVEYKHSLTAYDKATGSGNDQSYLQAMLFGSW